MRKLFLIIILLAAVGGGYFYLQPEVAKRWLKDTPLAPGPEITRVYKWQDAQGYWHVTDEPPPTGVEYEVTEYRDDVNVLPLPPQLQE